MYLHSNVAPVKLVTLVEKILWNPWSHHPGGCPSYCGTIFNKSATAQPIHRAVMHTYRSTGEKGFSVFRSVCLSQMSLAYLRVQKFWDCTPIFYLNSAIPFKCQIIPLRSHPKFFQSILRCYQAMGFRRRVISRRKSLQYQWERQTFQPGNVQCIFNTEIFNICHIN